MQTKDKIHEAIELFHSLNTYDKIMTLWFMRGKLFMLRLNPAIRPSRRAHWLYPRPHRYERRLFFWLAVIVVITSKPETLLYNVLIGMALSFGFMIYLYYQLVVSHNNDQ